MGESEKAIAQLQMIRETLNGFSKLVSTMAEAQARYGISFNEIQGGDTMTRLTDTLEPEKLGLFVKAILATQSLQSGMKNFMAYDQYQLDELDKKLQSTIKNLDQVLEGLV